MSTCPRRLPGGVCGRPAPAPSPRQTGAAWCPDCRAEARAEFLYPETCSACQLRRALDSNGACRACNSALGLRECTRCGEVQPKDLCYYGRSAVCKNCRRSKNSS